VAPSNKQATDPIIIKKYANRRLYNTAKSSYVTLDDLSRMVRAGDDFKVFDAKNGEEITHSVLTQIIFEEEAKGQNMLPTNFLRQLIRLYGDALQGVVPSYLDSAMETFSRNQEQMRSAFGGNQSLATFEAMARSNMQWFEQTMKMFAPFAPGGASHRAGQGPSAEPTAKQAQPTPEHAASLGQDLEQLQRQLHDMQTQLERLSKDTGPEKAAEPAKPTSQRAVAGKGKSRE
jgi:polyhydroxyalkanoate synthesis repressor PhaR